MKKNIKQIIFLIIFFFILINIFWHYQEIISSINASTKIYLFKIFPSIFTFMVIGNILINLNISKYIKNKYLCIVIMALLSGFPSNAKYVRLLYDKKILSTQDAQKALCFSSFANPLFLIFSLATIFSKKMIVIIIISHYLSNFLIYFIIDTKNNTYVNNCSNVSISQIISSSIKDSINTMLLILGTISFYTIIITIIKFYVHNQIILSIINGILEFSTGLNTLANLNISVFLKAYLALSYISFGSLSIFSQIKSILIDTNISLKYYLIFRIIHVFISCCIFTTCYIIFK